MDFNGLIIGVKFENMLKNDTWKLQDWILRAFPNMRTKFENILKNTILNFSSQNIAISSLRGDPHRNSAHQTRAWGVLALFVDPIREKKHLRGGEGAGLGQRVGGGGDDDSRPRAPWPGPFPSRTQE